MLAKDAPEDLLEKMEEGTHVQSDLEEDVEPSEVTTRDDMES